MFLIILKKRNLFPYLTALFFLLLCSSVEAKDKIDAESFFLLDVDQVCVDAKYLLGKEKDKYSYRNPPKLLKPGTFMIFEPNQSAPKNSIISMRQLKEEVASFFNQDRPRTGPEFHQHLLSRITPDSLILILKSLLNSPEMLDQVAKASYIHVMGFVKIVLLTGPEDNNYKVRLHLWWPDAEIDEKKLILEDKHIHKWNFASKMFSGSFEDQLFLINDVRRSEALTFVDFVEAVEKLSLDEQRKVLNSLNVIEAAMLEETKFQQEKFRCAVDKDIIYTKSQIMKMFDLNERDFYDIISVHANYITQPNVSGKYGLSKIGLKHLSFPVVYEIKENYSYFHHHSLAHRLISDPGDMVSTFLITAPPIESAVPSILMRSRDGEDISKVAPILTKEVLIKNIKRYIQFLEKRGN